MSAVFNSLRGEALAWFDGYRNEFRDNTDTWANFRQEFIKAFGKTNTAYTSAHALHSLQQKSNERVVDFFARVSKAFADLKALEPRTPADMRLPTTEWPEEMAALA